MNDLKFHIWLKEKNTSAKNISDIVSRCRKVERDLHLSIDEEYLTDKCKHLLNLFNDLGRNDEMRSINSNLPIGKPYINSYRSAIYRYIEYIESNDYSNE